MLYLQIQMMLTHIIIEAKIILNFIGISIYELGRKEDAIIDFTKALNINPLFASAYLKRGFNISNNTIAIAFSDLGKTDEAIIDFTNAIDMNSKYSDEAYYNRG